VYLGLVAFPWILVGGIGVVANIYINAIFNDFWIYGTNVFLIS